MKIKKKKDLNSGQENSLYGSLVSVTVCLTVCQSPSAAENIHNFWNLALIVTHSLDGFTLNQTRRATEKLTTFLVLSSVLYNVLLCDCGSLFYVTTGYKTICPLEIIKTPLNLEI